MKYRLQKSGVLKIEGTQISGIPEDPMNRDWNEYLLWLKKGNRPEPMDEEKKDDTLPNLR